ncbi:hypothetical protein A2U01_0038011 [Trifolium medium]|uniref:Retrotransposon Copia-like N-terminal domain-containing protein n=1 Tax=Trifolium medium TaxID=97028 RepID=A0A392PZX3_9FABA|nr:hypothetical protein [Trifolium medium]
MWMEKHDVFMVRLNGKNYSAWEFQFPLYVQGKDLWGHVDDTTPAPDKYKDKVEHAKWKTKDA